LPKSELDKDIAIVLVAAGRGERVGAPSHGPKQYRLIGGKPVLTHTIAAFISHPRVREIIVVIHADDLALFHQCWPKTDERVRAVYGGETRQASTRLGLLTLRERPPRYVMIHDGVRPFVDDGLLNRVIAELGDDIGVLPALAVTDTVKMRDGQGMISHTVPRNNMFVAQTPQAFSYLRIMDAHEEAFASETQDFTDDASIAECTGMAVKIVEGSPDNIKLTWKRDIDMANRKLNQSIAFPDVRTGNGYDVHSLEPGDHVTLCGVKISHTARLNGHSDADVALHALTDALLATRGAGDIGTHFPPSEAKWRGAASRIFVEHAAKLVRAADGRIANVDITLICEAPKIGPHREAMVNAIASMLNISVDRVSVKATTNEKLGFIGRNEGIAAIATASVVYPGSL
jgi:2-C-methyl-D-erythritol 4-phosphate cytidylyltransferase / 2-C-methyl-D-erythritol 2,4-cyclodiphosphate synthase